MIEIINNQRKIVLNTDLIQTFCKRLVKNVPEMNSKTATVVFISDRKMRELNSEFRGKKGTTDVLSFPFEAEDFESEFETLGEIVISAQQAEKQSKENKLTFEREIKQLILHGILHLCGFDHETDNGEMNEREIQLRQKLGI